MAYPIAGGLYEHGQLVICSDEKTGMQILQRKHPTQPARPEGTPRSHEQDYIRHGTRGLIASFVQVPTGPGGVGSGADGTPPRTSRPTCCTWLGKSGAGEEEVTWVLDNLNTHWSVEVCEVLAMLNDLPFLPAIVADWGTAARF